MRATGTKGWAIFLFWGLATLASPGQGADQDSHNLSEEDLAAEEAGIVRSDTVVLRPAGGGTPSDDRVLVDRTQARDAFFENPNQKIPDDPETILASLKRASPEQLDQVHQEYQRQMRIAQYFEEHKKKDPQLRKWSDAQIEAVRDGLTDRWKDSANAWVKEEYLKTPRKGNTRDKLDSEALNRMFLLYSRQVDLDQKAVELKNFAAQAHAAGATKLAESAQAEAEALTQQSRSYSDAGYRIRQALAGEADEGPRLTAKADEERRSNRLFAPKIQIEDEAPSPAPAAAKDATVTDRGSSKRAVSEESSARSSAAGNSASAGVGPSDSSPPSSPDLTVATGPVRHTTYFQPDPGPFPGPAEGPPFLPATSNSSVGSSPTGAAAPSKARRPPRRRRLRFWR